VYKRELGKGNIVRTGKERKATFKAVFWLPWPLQTPVTSKCVPKTATQLP
jgi:hypothetical protein